MSYLESVLKKLATGDPSRHLEPFPREALPNDRNDQLWETIRAEYRLTLPELSSLKNSVFGTPEGAGGLPAVQETKAKSNRPIKDDVDDDTDDLTTRLKVAGGDLRQITTYNREKMTAKSAVTGTKPTNGATEIVHDQEEGKNVFVRPARLHFRTIRDEGLPSPTEVEMTLNPDEMRNYFDEGGKSSDGGSIREAFDNQFELYAFYRTWRPSHGGLPSISDRQMLWRHAMLMIASHLDSGEPLNRIICWTLNDTTPISTRDVSYSDMKAAAGGGTSEEVKEYNSGDGQEIIVKPRGVVIDIEAIKQMKTSASPNTPVVFVRYAESKAGPGGLLTEFLELSANELPNHGSNQRTIHCTSDEIDYILSILDEASKNVSSSYQNKWKKKSKYNDKLFKLSFIRPALVPAFPHADAQYQRYLDRIERKKWRDEQRTILEKIIEEGKRKSKMETALRRKRRAQAELDEIARKDELVARKARGEIMNKTCQWGECNEIALMQCSRCTKAFYCSRRHQALHWHASHSSLCKQLEFYPCGLPGCKLRGTFRCSQCKTVFYCSEDHQRDHRPDHKKLCIPPKPAVTPPAATAKPTATATATAKPIATEAKPTATAGGGGVTKSPTPTPTSAFTFTPWASAAAAPSTTPTPSPVFTFPPTPAVAAAAAKETAPPKNDKNKPKQAAKKSAPEPAAAAPSTTPTPAAAMTPTASLSAAAEWNPEPQERTNPKQTIKVPLEQPPGPPPPPGVNVSGAKTFGIVIRPHPSGRGTIPLPHPNIHGPVPEAVQDIVDEAHARARLAKLPDSPIIYLSKEPNPNPGPWPGPEPFNKYIHTHPNSIGPGAVCPEDIWDDMIPPRESEVVNLYSFVTTKESGNPRGDWDPRDQPTPANEHELYMIRVLLPFMGDGTQLMVDEKSAFKLDINPGQCGYEAMKKAVGKKSLKGYFPARRHGDFIRVYIHEMVSSSAGGLGW